MAEAHQWSMADYAGLQQECPMTRLWSDKSVRLWVIELPKSCAERMKPKAFEPKGWGVKAAPRRGHRTAAAASWAALRLPCRPFEVPRVGPRPIDGATDPFF